MQELSGDNFWKSTSNLISCIKKVQSHRETTNSNQKNDIEPYASFLDVKLSKEENINSVQKRVLDSTASLILCSLIEDMYKFDFASSSSVGGKIANLTMNISLEELKSIDLLEHSFGVANFMEQIVAKKYGSFTSLFLILALVHDFGKSKKLNKAFMLDSEFGHWKASAQYLSAKVKTLKVSPYYEKLIGIIFEVVNSHHDKNADTIFDSIENKDERSFHKLFLSKLIEADIKQREAELEKIAKEEK